MSDDGSLLHRLARRWLADADAPYGRDERGEPLGPWGVDPRHLDPSSFPPVLRRLERAFGQDGPWPVEVQGLEHAPPPPALFVGSHAGGVMVIDGFSFGYIWLKHLADRPPLAMLGHEIVFTVPPVARQIARWGGLRTSPGIAERMITELGRDSLVMPGGDLDVFRPYRDRYKVDFHGRRGYARLALKTGVPIVPFCNSGPHATLVILARGQRIGRALGLRRVARAEVFPISLTVPWGLTPGPLPHLPLPARFRYRFGEPIVLPKPWRTWPAGAEPSDRAVDELDRRVRASMQAMFDELAEVTPGLRERLRKGLRA